MAHLWTKYLFVSPMGWMVSLVAKSFGGVFEDEKGEAMIRGLIEEMLRVRSPGASCFLPTA